MSIPISCRPSVAASSRSARPPAMCFGSSIRCLRATRALEDLEQSACCIFRGTFSHCRDRK